MSWGDYNIVSCSNRVWSGAGCFDIKEWADTTELTNVEVAVLEKCSYVVGKRKMFIKDEAQIASRVRGAERTVLYLG